MKKFLLSSMLVLGVLSSCQQVDSVEPADEAVFGFQGVTTDLLTRSGNKLDVVSLCSDNEQSFSAFSLLSGTRSWKDYGNGDVNFYAHYPQISESIQLDAEREVTSGEDLLFAAAQAASGTKTVVLNFKRVVVPVIIKVMNEDGTLSTPKFAKTKAAKKGMQNLKTGAIKANAAKEEINFDVNENGELVAYLLPQDLEEGTEFTVMTANEGTVTSSLTRSVSLSSDNSYSLVLRPGSIADMVIAPIVDPVIPL